MLCVSWARLVIRASVSDKTVVVVHINTFMHPQAMLVDASGVEDDYFLAAIRKQAPILNIPLIELPENAHSRLGWLTKLDSSSLGGKCAGVWRFRLS